MDAPIDVRSLLAQSRSDLARWIEALVPTTPGLATCLDGIAMVIIDPDYPTALRSAALEVVLGLTSGICQAPELAVGIEALRCALPYAIDDADPEISGRANWALKQLDRRITGQVGKHVRTSSHGR